MGQICEKHEATSVLCQPLHGFFLIFAGHDLHNYLPWNEKDSRFEQCFRLGDQNGTLVSCDNGWVHDK